MNVIRDILSFRGGGGVNTQQAAKGGTENSGIKSLRGFDFKVEFW